MTAPITVKTLPKKGKIILYQVFMITKLHVQKKIWTEIIFPAYYGLLEALSVWSFPTVGPNSIWLSEALIFLMAG